jgi:hypothetical protein
MSLSSGDEVPPLHLYTKVASTARKILITVCKKSFANIIAHKVWVPQGPGYDCLRMQFGRVLLAMSWPRHHSSIAVISPVPAPCRARSASTAARYAFGSFGKPACDAR